MPTSEKFAPEQTDRVIDKLWDKRAELLWGLVVVIMLLTFVDPVVLIGAALVVATIGAAWVGFHELMDRARQDDAASPATPLRVAQDRPRVQRGPSASTPWSGGHAA